MGTRRGPSDDEAFGAFVTARRAALLKVALRVMGDASEAEDVVQETLLAVWKRLDGIDDGKLQAYLFRAVKLNALQRRMRRRRLLPLDAIAEPARNEAEEPFDPFEVIGPAELEELIESLSEPQKAVLRMKYYLGMSFRQIGRTLAISRNTVASRCRYALAALRKAFGRIGRRMDRSSRRKR